MVVQLDVKKAFDHVEYRSAFKAMTTKHEPVLDGKTHWTSHPKMMDAIIVVDGLAVLLDRRRV